MRRRRGPDRRVLRQPVEARNTTNLRAMVLPGHVRCQEVPDDGAPDEVLRAFQTLRRWGCGVPLDGRARSCRDPLS